MAGFIGSHLAERLIQMGRHVVGVDDFDDYYIRATKERNLLTLRRDGRFKFVEADLAASDLSHLIITNCRLFHLAAQPGVRGSWGPQFDRYVRNNLLATQRILEACLRSPPSRIVYASSSSIYGDQPPGPCPENANPNPLSPYGMTKLAGEHLVRTYSKGYGLPAVALRFFTVFGPRQRPDMAFNRFIQAIRTHRPLTLFGDGRQTRDFTYVDDIVSGIVAAAEEEVAGETFNLGGGSPATVLDVLKLLEKLSGRSVEIEAHPPGVGEPRATWADTTRARTRLHYRPNVSLAEGLRRQWEWQSTEPLAS
ncbi:MAG: GDP-mannose 4,6-dehydratase [Thermoplasmata archaeon]|nr:GDP-mannose 4,6-dehydratase [Thermoplasmata archaeon]